MIVVLGSINLDIVLRPARLPAAGETVLAPGYALYPGGKGANQALAARRAGAEVALVGCVGDDDFAVPAQASLRAAGVDLAGVATVDAGTGVAMVAVDATGENQIVVASGANGRVRAEQLAPSSGDWLLLQMEIPHETNWAALAAARAAGMRAALNLAPASQVPESALAHIDVLFANELEAAVLARQFGQAPDAIAGWLALAFDLDCIVTLGAAGARASLADGRTLATSALPVEAVDTTAAGDAFVGVYVAARDAGLPAEACLARAIAAGSLACTTEGAQSSLPMATAIEAVAAKVAVSP